MRKPFAFLNDPLAINSCGSGGIVGSPLPAAPAADELPIVKRAAACWRNDLENIPIFLFLGLNYVTLGCWPTGAFVYFTIFAVARVLHTIVYLRGLQPARTICYGVGATICLILSIHILIAVL